MMQMSYCMNCHTTSTPMWRRLNDNATGLPVNLCNACGLYYKTKGVHRPKVLVTKKSQLEKYKQIMDCVSMEVSDPNRTKIVQVHDEDLNNANLISCSNCKCINTSLWRKDPQGNNLCNACGLFFKKNGVHRKSKQEDKGIFIEIDQKLIKFNAVKRRKRRVANSQPHGLEGQRRSSISTNNSATVSPTSMTFTPQLLPQIQMALPPSIYQQQLHHAVPHYKLVSEPFYRQPTAVNGSRSSSLSSPLQQFGVVEGVSPPQQQLPPPPPCFPPSFKQQPQPQQHSGISFSTEPGSSTVHRVPPPLLQQQAQPMFSYQPAGRQREYEHRQAKLLAPSSSASSTSRLPPISALLNEIDRR